METRFVPDAPTGWLVYELGNLILALPSELRAAGDAIAALPSVGVSAALVALEASGIAEGAPFAVLEPVSGGLHVALRGPATVAAGAATLTGLGAKTPVERFLPRVSVVRLTVPGGEWMMTLNATPTSSASVSENSEVTAIPDVELSLPVLPPPPLGLHVSDRRVETEGTPAAQTVAVPELPPYPSVPSLRAPAVALREGDAADDDDWTVVIDDILKQRDNRSEPRETLRTLGSAMIGQPPSRPKLSLELPDGSRQPLDAVVLVGRAPSAPAGGPASRLVRLEGDGDISRNHARVAVEGGTVVVTDLGSRNGTIVRIPGRPSQKLREGEPTPVLVDTVIDFGGGIEVSVREG